MDSNSVPGPAAPSPTQHQVSTEPTASANTAGWAEAGDALPRGGARTLTLLGFALFSATILAAQIVLSRLFASTLGCYYSFALVSLALLGLGAGGLFVQLFPRAFRAEWLPVQGAILALCSSAFCFAALLGYLRLYPAFRDGGWLVSFGVFAGFLPFFLAGGTLVSLVLAHGRASFHRLYALDLLSAAIGALLALAALGGFHPSEVVLLGLAVAPLLAALAFAFGSGRRWLIVTAVCAPAVALPLAILLLRDPRVADPPHVSRLDAKRVLHASNTMSNVSVFEGPFFTWALSPRYAGPVHRMLDLVIDGVGGTEIVEFDGSLESLRSERYAYLDDDLTALGQALVPANGRHLVIGPGAGVDLLQSVRRGRQDVTAVEINPLVARVVNQDLASFSGRPYQLPGVRAIIENGRTFAERTAERWDLISLTWVDTGGQASAMASSENYLYTVESYERFFTRLSDHGYFAFMRALGLGGDLRIDGVRGVAVAAEALRRLGVRDPAQHMVLAGVASPWFGRRAMLYALVKRSPFTSDEVAQAREFLHEREFGPLWLPGGAPVELEPAFAERAALLRQIVTAPEPERLVSDAHLDIAPSTDDNPFYFVERAGPSRPAGEGVTLLQRNLSVLLALIVPFLLLPMLPVLRRTRRLGLRGGAALLYFALLGVGFMLVEVELFQVYALLLGNPTLALATVLSTMLLASGIGSYSSARLASARPAVIAATFALLVGLLAAFALGQGALLRALVELPLALRVIATVGSLAPLGFLMGLPLAAGMSFVADREDIVLWGWALNGSFSVLASVLAVYGAIHVGFARMFLIGMGAYALAGVCLLVMRRAPAARAVYREERALEPAEARLSPTA